MNRAAPALLTPPEVNPGTVRAAGALLWRRAGDDLEVLLVHRPKYDDWSWPKGKLDEGETWPGAAVREVLEETGLHCELGIPLPRAAYDIGASGAFRPKVVQYWAAREVAGDGELAHEVDEVAWLGVPEARERLHYRRDLEQLKALARSHRAGLLDTWPLVLVRHARTVARRRWRGDDSDRPLDEAGQEQARQLVPVLQAFGVQRVLTSDAERCAATVAPFARLTGQRLLGRHSLSEEGYADDPERALRQLDKALARGEATALCTHRPLLPALLHELAQRTDDPHVRTALRDSASAGLLKGELLVAHVAGPADAARVVAVERHTPG
ncbi:MAG TPA: NUDIX hydrolase [Angustibacter sp.]|nr:NUDIX hydrolase [Angustibacter sp.]